MPAATQLSYLGIAKESVKGTGVAPTAFWPVKTITPEDVVKYLPVEVLKGAFPKVYGEVQGYKNTTFEVGGPVFADTFGWSLGGVLGDVTHTASRSVSDAVTNGTTTVTSATASFTSADTGKSVTITGANGLPSGTVIQSVTNGTTIVCSQAATGSAGSQTLTIGPPHWHVFNVSNSTSTSGQPTSHTLTDYYNSSAASPARQYAGIQWHEVAFKFTAEGLLEHTSKGTGLVPSAQVAKPSQSFTTVQPTPSWTGIVTIGGTVISTIADGDLTITRTMELIPALTGTQQYANVWIGDITCKGKLTAIVTDDTELTRMLTNAQPSLDLNFTQLSGTNSQQVVFHMTNAAYLKAKPNRGKQWVAFDIEWEAIGNSTDVGSTGGFGVITGTVGNNIASGTYI